MLGVLLGWPHPLPQRAQDAAYVHDHNIYSEDLITGKITLLTRDGSDKIINGTSDWVYEEEFNVRAAFCWSPDSRRIAYWQFDDNGVKDYALVYDSGGPHQVVTGIPYPQYGVYPTIQRFGYPEAGTTNPAARVGVVGADGGTTQWMDVPGNPRESYIARLEWAGNAGSERVQYMGIRRSFRRDRRGTPQPAAEHERCSAHEREHRGRAPALSRPGCRLAGRGR